MNNLVFDAEFGEVAADLGSDLGLCRIKITICIGWICLEICFLVPAFGCGAVGHAQNAILCLEGALDNINPHCDDGCHVFEEVVGSPIQQMFRDVPAPSSAVAAVAAEAVRAGIRTIHN